MGALLVPCLADFKPSLKSALEAAADADRRSISAMVEILLEESLAERAGRSFARFGRFCGGCTRGAFLGSTPENRQTASYSRNRDGRWKRGYAEKEGLPMDLSLYLRSTLGIIFFQSLDKFGEPFLRLKDTTRPRALVVDQHRSLPALRQWPWLCDAGA
jgi:hypothetical protein